MNRIIINKGLVCGLVFLLAGTSLGIAAGAQQEPIATAKQTFYGVTVPDPRDLMGAEAWQQVQHTLANKTRGYLLYSSSGTGNSLHLFAKIPHLRNSNGFCVGGIILYTGLTALTMVWRIANGTASEVVKLRPGPHVVVFAGFGYSFFLRNRKGGSGRVVAVSLTQPSVMP